jgi:hypothetical protein
MSAPPPSDDQLERSAEITPKLRRCLRCKSEFNSEWAGERICRRCKGTVGWRKGAIHQTHSTGRRV